MLGPDLAALLDCHLVPDAIATELAFFNSPGGATFERPYGSAWLLELQAELLRSGRKQWAEALEPLATALARRFAGYLVKLPYPVRSGTHGNSAFACVLALDYARAAQSESLVFEIGEAARRWYLTDRDYPVAYEPSPGPLAAPPTVLDHADAKQSHLDGLCLSRAWCFKRLGFDDLSRLHLEAGLPHVVGGDYASEHWLASFATLALSAEALRSP